MVLDKLVAIFLLIIYSARNVNGATSFLRLTFFRATTLTIPLQQTNLIILIKAHSPFLNNLPIHLFAWVKNHIFSGTFPQLFLHFQQLQFHPSLSHCQFVNFSDAILTYLFIYNFNQISHLTCLQLIHRL